jgi:hypothetical protein
MAVASDGVSWVQQVVPWVASQFHSEGQSGCSPGQPAAQSTRVTAQCGVTPVTLQPWYSVVTEPHM